jgi:hypothetical protein
MRASHKTSRNTLAACALLGLAVTLTACGQNAAASPPAKTPASPARSTKAPASPAHPAATTTPPVATTPASPPPASPPPPAPAPQVPGVVSGCTYAPPLRLSVDPAAITLACADDGLGVERISWTDWAGTIATGQGMFWQKLCQPNCAEGKIGTYPVAVALSAVKSSPQGPWFSHLTVTWEGARPPGTTPSSYPLTPPTS